MTRFVSVAVIALAVLGYSVAYGTAGSIGGVLDVRKTDSNVTASGAGSEVPLASPANAKTAPGDAPTPPAPPERFLSTPAGEPEPEPAPPAAMGGGEEPQPAAAASAAADTLLEPALLPPMTQGVRVLNTLPTSKPVVNLTFDVEGDAAPAIAILDALKKEGVKGSFGLTGTFVKAHPDVVRRMAAEGHDIFNHTFNHPVLPAIGPAQRQAQLRQMEAMLQEVLGRKPVAVFRPPYGAHNPAVLKDIAAMGYPWVLMWDVDPQGFRGYSAAHIAGKVVREAKAGSVILMHGIKQDAAALPGMIKGLKEKGFGFVTVSQALGLK